MKKVVLSVVMLLFVAALAATAFGADKVVGEIKEVVSKDGKITALKIADEKQGGKVVELNCGRECAAAKGTTLKAGEKVTAEPKGDFVKVRKAVAGC